MKNHLIIILLVALLSCQKKQTPKQHAFELPPPSMDDDLMVGDYQLVSKLPDTTSLQGRIAWIKIQMMKIEAVDVLGEMEDTMFDVNYDGRKDLILKYPLMHLGFETSVYNMNADSSFSKNSILWGLPNVTFDIKSKKVTSFYHGPNAGDGIRLEWNNGKWDTTMSYTVENTMDLATWQFFYPKIKKKKTNIRRSYSKGFPDEM